MGLTVFEQQARLMLEFARDEGHALPPGAVRQPDAVPLVAILANREQAHVNPDFKVKQTVAELQEILRYRFENPRYAPSELEQAHARIELLQRDTLTGLKQRRQCREHLDQLIAANHEQGISGKKPDSFAVIVFDLDHFKEANDTLGHAGGDDVLKRVAKKLNEIIRDGDEAYRLGGDEFVVLSPQLDAKGAEALANRICSALAEEFAKDELVQVTASVRCVFIPRGQAVSAEVAMEIADGQAYKAKGKDDPNGGRNRAFTTVCTQEKITEAQQKLGEAPVPPASPQRRPFYGLAA